MAYELVETLNKLMYSILVAILFAIRIYSNPCIVHQSNVFVSTIVCGAPNRTTSWLFRRPRYEYIL